MFSTIHKGSSKDLSLQKISNALFWVFAKSQALRGLRVFLEMNAASVCMKSELYDEGVISVQRGAVVISAVMWSRQRALGR